MRFVLRHIGMPLRLLCLLALLPVMAAAQDSPFGSGWTLQPDGSSLLFQSVKNGATVETSSFATFTGAISPDGQAEIRVLIDSVDTKIDLRNVRMRFLFFESFLYPEAVISARIDPALLADLPTNRRVTFPLPYTLTLHGVTKDNTAPVSVTLLSDDLVSIATTAPILIPVADYNLTEGLTKLQEAANVVIVPSGSVTFDLLFKRSDGAEPALTPAPAAEPATAALETAGNFDPEACAGRFEILSKAGNISFNSGSATLDPASDALLDTLLDVIQRCPDMRIEVGGHTDSEGSDAANLRLSERRANAVAAYLVERNVPADRLVVRGYGEAQPFVPNDSAENMRRNRRIEFLVIGN